MVCGESLRTVSIHKTRKLIIILPFETFLANYRLKKIKDEHPELKAAIMGTRRTDPYSSHLTSFTPCDPDWPPFMRVNPILDWSYGDVWYFLRSLSLPYCELYDRGYTSLGAADNTFPCPKLEYVDEFGRTAFHPAYELTLENEERDGRLV